MAVPRTSRGPRTTGVKGRRRTAGEPLLEIHDIQGNVLAGFNKDHQALIAIAIRDVASARRWLGRIAGAISSTAEVLQFNDLFRMQRVRLDADPPGLVATWANLARSHDGLAALMSAAHADLVPDAASRQGLPERASLLGDPGPAADPTAGWVVGAKGRVPHMILIVASDDPAKLADVCARLRPGAGDGAAAPDVIWEELGETRVDRPGHEHFGFKDGVSQPAVRGMISRRPNMFLAPRLLAPAGAGQVQCARPGQPLVWPGQFVFGYPSTDASGGTGGGPVPPPKSTPTWIRNASLLVFRRLSQDVAGFTQFVRKTADDLAVSGMPGLSGMSPAHLGALIVGRWASGAPIARAPGTDLPAIAADTLANNDFLFTINTPPPVFLPGVPGSPNVFPAAVTDRRGVICPHAAHIRKMNPRDQATSWLSRRNTSSDAFRIHVGVLFGGGTGPSPVPPLASVEG